MAQQDRGPAALLDRDSSGLLIVDLQVRLLPVIAHHQAVLSRARLLLQAAAELRVPLLATVHAPDSLGPLVPVVESEVPTANQVGKTAFGACQEAAFMEALGRIGRRTIVVAGTETHICVLQTALGLLQNGYRVAIVADACGTRHALDHSCALDRLARAGAEIVSSDMVVFEWLNRADHPAFRKLLPGIKRGQAA
mgnify:CR=1 FL=1